MDGLITALLVMVIDLYMVLLFVRIFVTERERYESVLGLVFTATDPIVRQLQPLLPWRSVSITALVVIVALLLFKGILEHSISLALLGVADTLLRLYVLSLIILATVREYYINPIANLAQRLVRPVQTVAMQVTPHRIAVNVISIALLIVAHAMVRLVLRDLMGSDGLQALLPKEVFIFSSLHLIVNLTVFFTYVIIINALMSWVSPDPLNPIVQLLTLIAAPITDPIRRVVPPLGGVMDLSPVVAIVALQFANIILHSFLDVVERSLT
jgi:YggT family protein